MEKNMELEEAIEILNNYLCETHRKFCSIGAVGIPNKEYFAIETVLNHLKQNEHELNSQRNYCKMIEEQKDDIIKAMVERMSKQEKMIELMINAIDASAICDYFIKENCENYLRGLAKTCNICIREYFEKKAEEVQNK